MELKAAEKGEGEGEMGEEVGCEGREGSGVDVGLWEDGGGHDGGRKEAEVSRFGARINWLMIFD